MTLGKFLKKHAFSRAFIDFHIVPVSAAIWSTPSENILDFPAESLLSFFNHHGLLTLANRPQWQTVAGGSVSYIRAFEKLFKGKILKACPVRHVERITDKVRVVLEDQKEMHFDYVVLATHADISLQLLIDPQPDESRILSKWKYIKNHVDLHTDMKVMPPNRKAWASWSYFRFGNGQTNSVINMSYYMNRLHKITTDKDYFVTLNGTSWIDSNQRIKSVKFDHPCYTFDSLGTHKELDSINGNDRLYYCGAYCGYGFHEDGARSGLAVAQKFGVEL
jgi:predicted NAD/FAD-binding protein